MWPRLTFSMSIRSAASSPTCLSRSNATVSNSNIGYWYPIVLGQLIDGGAQKCLIITFHLTSCSEYMQFP